MLPNAEGKAESNSGGKREISKRNHSRQARLRERRRVGKNEEEGAAECTKVLGTQAVHAQV
jgi:hypothetical protein